MKLIYIGLPDGGHQCRLSMLRSGNLPCRYFLNVPVDYKIVLCRLSNLRNAPCHVTNTFAHVDRLHVACRLSILRNGCVALSNLRVKNPYIVASH